jgi:hypothetical protein
VRLRVVTLLCTLLTAAVWPAAARAQSADPERIYGVKGGLVRTNFAFEEDEELFTSQNGWIAGVFAASSPARTLGWMGELNIVRKSQLCGCGQLQVDLYYLQIPALVRVNRRMDAIALYGVAGPALELKIGEQKGTNLIREYSKVDVSFMAGGGVEFGNLIVEVRGGWGLRTIAASFQEQFKVTAQTAAFLVGYRFK